MPRPCAAQALYGYGKLYKCGLRKSSVPLAELSAAIDRTAPSMDSQNVSNVLWAYGALGAAPPPSTFAAVDAAAFRLAPHMTPEGLANTLWAFGTLMKAPSRETLDALDDAARDKAEAMDRVGNG